MIYYIKRTVNRRILEVGTYLKAICLIIKIPTRCRGGGGSGGGSGLT